MIFDNIEKLLKHLDKQYIAPTMQNEMADMVKDEEQRIIDKTVYDAYKPGTSDGEPWVYKRRRDKGGLRSRDNMVTNVHQSVEGVELTVENVTKGANGYRIDEVIESGKGYEFTTNRDGTASQYTSPRPFTKNTEESIASKDLHTKTMRKALKEKGLDII